MALNGIPIDPQQCMGDSLEVLNNSFIELDSRTLTISSNLQQSLSSLYTTIQNVSGNLYTASQEVTSNLYTTIQETSGIIATTSLTSVDLSGVVITDFYTTASTFTADNIFLKLAVGNICKFIELYDINDVYNEVVDPL